MDDLKIVKSWRERIVAAGARGRFTNEDLDLASSWATCAVGEQREAMPTVVLYRTRLNGCLVPGFPADRTLYRLGASAPENFMDAVRANNRSLAESLLDQIEDRVLELKREVTQ